ncbi:hypothetical protein BCR35DRAFT_311036 [Leucosporidium creatinivorum]|uniref:Uncharacterized protein n=1 Tax=Leucosporidium creatinivorum TaxID=106004 RepID=A0A1Y2CGY4_9BASI|nr:hypothetical protein BCR35DRAFT_311036 [Leucosporidium creatinivorum]
MSGDTSRSGESPTTPSLRHRGASRRRSLIHVHRYPCCSSCRPSTVGSKGGLTSRANEGDATAALLSSLALLLVLETANGHASDFPSRRRGGGSRRGLVARGRGRSVGIHGRGRLLLSGDEGLGRRGGSGETTFVHLGYEGLTRGGDSGGRSGGGDLCLGVRATDGTDGRTNGAEEVLSWLLDGVVGL